MKVLETWIKAQNIDGLELTVDYDDTKSPFLIATIKETNLSKPKNILIYSHMDKQPPNFSMWKTETSPYKPYIKNNKLYGRGSVDNGYAIFSTIIAIKKLKEQGEHNRFTIIIEGSEESGSIHLEHYLDKYNDIIKKPHIIYCLNSGGPTFDRLWITSSIRGCLMGQLSITSLKESVHSGDAGGIVPEPFDIARILINRLKNTDNLEIASELHMKIPNIHYKKAFDTALFLGRNIFTKFPYKKKINSINISDPSTQFKYYLKNIWEPSISVIGIEGLPNCSAYTNTINPSIKLNLSIRTSPSMDLDIGKMIVKSILERNPPFSTSIKYTNKIEKEGWVASNMNNTILTYLDNISKKYFGKKTMFIGGGGTIPYATIISNKYKYTPCIITGLLVPSSNHHIGDENLDLTNAKKFTKIIIDLLK